MRIGTAWSFFAQLLSQSGQTSGVTSKPAIEGHFKTGQRTSTLDDLSFTLPGGGLASSLFGSDADSAGRYSSPPLPVSGSEI